MQVLCGTWSLETKHVIKAETLSAIDETMEAEQAASCIPYDHITELVAFYFHAGALFCRENLMVAPEMRASTIDLDTVLRYRFSQCIMQDEACV